MRYSILLIAVLMGGMVHSLIAQSSKSEVLLLQEEQEKNFRKIDHIDSEGRSGEITGYLSAPDTEIITFSSETETGTYSEHFIFTNGLLVNVEITEVQFNRPKFWNQSVAESNGDSEWYDPEKSIISKTIYHFTDGNLEFWINSDGSEGYPLNKKLKKIGTDLEGKAISYRKLLEK